MPDAVPEARALRKEYGELVAVDDVDITVPEGGSEGVDEGGGTRGTG